MPVADRTAAQLRATWTFVVIGPGSRSRSLSSGARSLVELRRTSLASHTVVIPRACGVSSTPQLLDSITDVSEYWIARSSRAMTAGSVARSHSSDATPHSRGAMRPSPSKSEGAGNAGCSMHPQPRVRSLSEAHERSHHGHTGNHPAFPAQWFYGLFRALPGDEFVLSPSLAD